MRKKPSDLYIRFHHKDITNISDRTLRQLIREFSKVTNEILLAEIDYILIRTDVPYNIKQSIRDRLRAQSSEIANFYVEEIKNGSLTLFVLVPATMIVTVGVIVLACVNEFKKGAKRITEKDAIEILAKSKVHMEERSEKVMNDILPKFENKELGNRFILERFTRSNEEDKIVMEASVSSTIEESQINHEKVTNAVATDFLSSAEKRITKRKS